MKSSRRNFLKFLLIGGGAFALGRFLGPNLFKKTEPRTETKIGNFKVAEDGNEIIFTDSGGTEILILDKDVF